MEGFLKLHKYIHDVKTLLHLPELLPVTIDTTINPNWNKSFNKSDTKSNFFPVKPEIGKIHLISLYFEDLKNTCTVFVKEESLKYIPIILLPLNDNFKSIYISSIKMLLIFLYP